MGLLLMVDEVDDGFPAGHRYLRRPAGSSGQ
jgi:hypothetical protein